MNNIIILHEQDIIITFGPLYKINDNNIMVDSLILFPRYYKMMYQA